jgi:uncharacterized protein (DUF1015 family)
MADVSPFRPYRYSSKAGRLDDLVTQPYDKISPAMQKRYLSLNPYNLVRVILGERFPTDSDTGNVYTRAARELNEWIASGVLERDSEPAFYAYFQDFAVPGTGERLVRKGFIGLGAVEDYSAGIVHRHEQTLSGPKKDRLELLRHTRTHFGQLFMLYDDPARQIDAILDQAAISAPTSSVTDEYGVMHSIWRVTGPECVAGIRSAMASKKLIIADGHHRYETALAFRNEHPELEDARLVMMTFVNMHSPGLRILATHRLVDQADVAQFLARARLSFKVTEVTSLEALNGAWAAPHADAVRLGIAAAPGSLFMLEARRQPEQLDVPFLHESILRDVLGISEDQVRDERRIRYMRGAEAAIEEVRGGKSAIAFLLEPTAVEDVARVAFSGGVMPQKSTDFYPKLLSGLTAYRLEK